MAKKETTKKKITKKTIKKSTMEQASVIEEVAKDKATLEFVNGDPSVLSPVQKHDEINEDNPHEYTSLVPETIINEPQIDELEMAKCFMPDASEHKKTKIDTKPKDFRHKITKNMIGYSWNGIEMDY